MLPVDEFMRRNKTMAEDFTYEEHNAVAYRMDEDEFRDVYGFTVDQFDEQPPKVRAYELNRRNPELIIILSECIHQGKKQLHHPDYNRPFEVEKLCLDCHFLRHKLHAHLHFSPSFSPKAPMNTTKLKEIIFNRSQAAMTANDSSTVAPSEDSLIAVTSQDRATQQSYSSAVDRPSFSTSPAEINGAHLYRSPLLICHDTGSVGG